MIRLSSSFISIRYYISCHSNLLKKIEERKKLFYSPLQTYITGLEYRRYFIVFLRGELMKIRIVLIMILISIFPIVYSCFSGKTNDISLQELISTKKSQGILELEEFQATTADAVTPYSIRVKLILAFDSNNNTLFSELTEKNQKIRDGI